MNKELFIAHHESGHVILALLNNCNIQSVTMTAIDGLTLYEYFPSQKLSQHKCIQILAAGYLAEKHLSETVNAKYRLKTSCHSDFSKINTILKNNKVLNNDKISYLAKGKVTKYWSDIALVANLLLNNKEASSSEIEYVLTKFSTKKPFWIKKFKTIHNKY